MVLPRTDSRLIEPDDPDLDRWPRLANWVNETECLWAAHRSTSTTANSTEWLNYHGKLNSQFPLAPLRVVYTKSGNTLAAAVLRDMQGVVDHVLYWAATTSLSEARYLTAVLNAQRRRGELGLCNPEAYSAPATSTSTFGNWVSLRTVTPTSVTRRSPSWAPKPKAWQQKLTSPLPPLSR